MPPFFLFCRHFLHDGGQVHLAEVPDLLRVLGFIVQQNLLQHGLLHRVAVPREQAEELAAVPFFDAFTGFLLFFSHIHIHGQDHKRDGDL